MDTKTIEEKLEVLAKYCDERLCEDCIFRNRHCEWGFTNNRLETINSSYELLEAVLKANS